MLAERFPQFRGLVDRSQEEQGDRRVQLGDLQGFWEMIFIQVTDPLSVFAAVLAMTAPGGRCQLQVCGFGGAGGKQLGADTARGQDGGEGG